MNIIKLTVAMLFTLCISSAIAENEKATIGDVAMAVSSNSPAFEAVKQKLGKWEGQMTQTLDGAVFDVSYEYKLTSGGNTITETIVEDGVEMLSTYSDEDGKLVVKHYCALGTEPVFKVSGITSSSISISLDEAKNDLHIGHHSFVTGMTWTTDSQNPNSMVFENSVSLDGKITTNKATLKRSM